MIRHDNKFPQLNIGTHFPGSQPFLFNNHSSLTDKVTVGLYNLQGFKNYYAGNLTRLDYFISDRTFYNNASLDFTAERCWVLMPMLAAKVF